jgi:hypothetical protein
MYNQVRLYAKRKIKVVHDTVMLARPGAALIASAHRKVTPNPAARTADARGRVHIDIRDYSRR